MTKLGAGALFVAAALTGCTTGNDPTPPNPNGMTCTAALTLQGTFTPDASRPTGYTGCWGAGQWTFTAAVASNSCATAPQVAPSYQFTAASEADMNGDPVVDKFTLTAPNPASFMNIVKLSTEGNGICEGEVDLCSADMLQVWTLRPDVQDSTSTSITGQGEFTVYSSPHCPTN